MDREMYRKAFDNLSFSENFQARTEALLRDRAQDMEKEQTMKTCRTTRKTVMLAAAMAAMLAVSVSAAVLWLSPSQVAEHMEEPLLAAAFESEDAVAIGETGAVGDYTVTLAGLGIHSLTEEELAMVAAIANSDKSIHFLPVEVDEAAIAAAVLAADAMGRRYREQKTLL